MKTYHITYYLTRESENGPLLSGITIQAENILFAINIALHQHNIPEQEIKYVIEHETNC